MKLLHKLYQKCCVMQWSIGLSNADMNTILETKKLPSQITWLPLKHDLNFMADPFLVVDSLGNIHLLYEDFSVEKNGTIELKVLDARFNLLLEKTLLKKTSHLSYPFIFKENGKIYVIPESHQEKTIRCYEYDTETQTLNNEKILMQGIPLLDATIFKKDGRYWMFANHGDGIHDNEELHLYFSESLFGPYQPHPKNPIKQQLNGSRPAGSILSDKQGRFFRPAQNCSEYYGHSMTLFEIVRIDSKEYEEKEYCEFQAGTQLPFNKGIHTLNHDGNFVVIDGIRFLFRPLTKLRLLLKKHNIIFRTT